MRVQLQGQALRLRIDEAELERLLAGAVLDNVTRWPDGHARHQRLLMALDHAWEPDADGWRVRVAESGLRALAARLPSREGLRFALATGGEPLAVLVDVDVHGGARRRRSAASPDSA